MAEVAETLTDWKSDYTGADTNTPTGVSDPGSTGAATSLGAWLRSLKAITRALSLEPGFDVMPTTATYLTPSSFEIAAADVTHTVGDSVLISLGAQDLRAYVSSFLHLSGPTRTQFSVVRIQQLNGTAAVLDGTLTHVRWSQHRFPTYPWSWHDRHGINAVPAFATLPLREQVVYTVWLKTGETSIEVHLPYEMPDTNYRVKLTPTSVTDAATVRAYTTKTVVKTTTKVTLTIVDPPTGLNVFTVWIWRD